MPPIKDTVEDHYYRQFKQILRYCKGISSKSRPEQQELIIYLPLLDSIRKVLSNLIVERKWFEYFTNEVCFVVYDIPTIYASKKEIKVQTIRVFRKCSPIDCVYNFLDGEIILRFNFNDFVCVDDKTIYLEPDMENQNQDILKEIKKKGRN